MRPLGLATVITEAAAATLSAPKFVPAMLTYFAAAAILAPAAYAPVLTDAPAAALLAQGSPPPVPARRMAHRGGPATAPGQSIDGRRVGTARTCTWVNTSTLCLPNWPEKEGCLRRYIVQLYIRIVPDRYCKTDCNSYISHGTRKAPGHLSSHIGQFHEL